MRGINIKVKLAALIVSCIPLISSAKQSVILSGQIKASDNQSFYAPKTDTWRVQLQWMLPEGDVAQKGDLVVVFDSGSIQSQIEQEEVSLLAAEEELHRKEITAKQNLLEATYAKKRTELLLKKARIDAAISVEHLSQYDYENNQLSLEKAILENAKASDNLKQTIIGNKVSVEKQRLTLKKHQDKINYNESKLEQMSIYAERSGPVIYGYHPWNGEKIFVGMTAQPSWKVAEIPAMNGLFIEAWAHEVDYKHLMKNSVVNLIFDAFPTQPLTAKLSKISTQPEERKEWGKGVYYRTEFTFEQPKDIALLPGMSAQLVLNGGQHE